ncbi:predicted protein [Verticillium alfalfae VaMs.102]|uniref:Predicted protein n=1 Tax=Verticillium alfalfae (strain VaMs.102 / ATCC MYA-4576 / FGSC 10136) TaxID=526221 RepID=C9SWN3_VERA1|nr:predicted protein [Verticillium alfalfae VaMs.102]EEY23198.1 predicted protein [Verticillium alfalfae VaMs.102]
MLQASRARRGLAHVASLHAHDAMKQVVRFWVPKKAKAGGPIARPIALYLPIFCLVERMGICNVPLEITTLPSRPKRKTESTAPQAPQGPSSWAACPLPLHLSFLPCIVLFLAHRSAFVPDAPPETAEEMDRENRRERGAAVARAKSNTRPVHWGGGWGGEEGTRGQLEGRKAMQRRRHPDKAARGKQRKGAQGTAEPSSLPSGISHGPRGQCCPRLEERLMVQPQQTAGTMNDQPSPSEVDESPLSGGAMDGSSQSTLQPVESPIPLIPPPSSAATQDAGHDPVPQQTPSARSSWSASSGRQPGHSPDLSDRVFPIRSVVSVNPAGRTSGEHGYFPRMPDHGQYTAARPDAPRPRRSDSVSQPAASAVTSPTDDRQTARNRRKHTSSGPISSIQADAARHANSMPLPIFESDACGSEGGHSSRLDRSNTSQPSHAQPVSTPAGSVPDSHGLILPRFRHVTTDDGHAVITGPDAVLQHCEDEPIHTPGAVQGFGLLLALREDQEGGFSVRYTSENSERIIGYSPKQLFNLASFLDILSEEQQDNLLDHIDFIRDEDADPATNGPEVFSLTVRSSGRKSTKLWCAIHINPAHPDLIICEFELDDDHLYPLRPADGGRSRRRLKDTLRSDPTMEGSFPAAPRYSANR